MKSEGKEFLEHLERVADPEDLPLLVAACAGRTVYVPQSHTHSESWISLAIGVEKANALLAELKKDGFYGGEIRVPFNGHGLYAMIQRAIGKRVTAGLIAGKSARLIAAECGITDRAVHFRRQKLREGGLLPEVDEAVALATAYHSSSTPAKAAPSFEFRSLEAKVGSNDEFAAFVEAAQPTELVADEQVTKQTPVSRPARIVALIEQVHGRATGAQIVRIAAGQPVSFHPRAVKRPNHPFRVVLGETEAALLAVKIVASGLGNNPACLSSPVVRRNTANLEIGRLLKDGWETYRIAKHLDVSASTVRSVRRRLRRGGELKAPGYKGI